MSNHSRGFTSRRHPELDSGSCCISNQGFTLLEVLVVVIIIAVLAAIAVPQYKHAVLKSRFSAVMPMAKSVADANEVYYLGKNMYALGQDDLDVTPVTAENTSVKLSGEYQNANEDYEYVAAWRTDVPGVRYIQYQKNSPKFASNIHCEADETNEDALWLCEKGLNGTEIPGSINMAEGDYKTFLLAGNIGTDKLPTSINKLKAQICGTQFTGDYCVVDEENQTITTRACDELTSSNYAYIPGGSSSDSGVRCTNTVYDQEGNLTDSSTKVCTQGATMDSQGNCMPTAADLYGNHMYEYVMGADGKIYSESTCFRFGTEGCTSQFTYTCSNGANSYSFYDTGGLCSGVKRTITRWCSNGYVNESGGCSTGNGTMSEQITGTGEVLEDGSRVNYIMLKGSLRADGTFNYNGGTRQIIKPDGSVVNQNCLPTGSFNEQGECTGTWQ